MRCLYYKAFQAFLQICADESIVKLHKDFQWKKAIKSHEKTGHSEGFGEVIHRLSDLPVQVLKPFRSVHEMVDNFCFSTGLTA